MTCFSTKNKCHDLFLCLFLFLRAMTATCLKKSCSSRKLVYFCCFFSLVYENLNYDEVTFNFIWSLYHLWSLRHCSELYNSNNNNNNNNNNSNDNNNHIQRRNLRFVTISSLRCEPSPTHTLKWPGHNLTFKGAIWDLWQSPHCAVNRPQHTRSSGPGTIMYKSRALSTYHVLHFTLHARWYEGTAQLLSVTEFKSHLFEL